jgi:hypothetical protein
MQGQQPFSGPTTILPPPAQEIRAKRMMRKQPENTAYLAESKRPLARNSETDASSLNLADQNLTARKLASTKK